jgi:hypothetical protein
MRYAHRQIEPTLLRAARSFPAVVLTGARRTGKTTLLRRLFPAAEYHLFEDPDVVSRFRADPQGFLDGVRTPAIFDEIQNVPELFPYVRSRIDRHPQKSGQWFLTGSQESGLMRGVTESLAGRAAILELWPMSSRESRSVSPLRGGFPEVLARPRAADLWFSSYVQTYLERDVRSISAIQDLPTFRRFLALVAARHGQMLNKSDLAAPLGMSIPGIGRWLDILEITAQVIVVPPYFENYGKRLTKTPKLYVADAGLACHLLGIASEAELRRSPFRGSILEGLVAAEIAKAQTAAGLRRELYYFRDHQGLEVDFVVPGRAGRVTLVEVKAGGTPRPEMAVPMQRLSAAMVSKGRSPGDVAMSLLYEPAKGTHRSRALAAGVEAIPWREFVATVA